MSNNEVINKKKDNYWLCIRGICILCVILIHCKNGIGYQDALNYSWNFDYWLILRQVINFPVAMFIFLAGFFTNVKKVEESSVTYIPNRGGEITSTVFNVVSTLYID